MILSPCCQVAVEVARRMTLSYRVNPKTGRVAQRRTRLPDEENDTGDQVACTKCGVFYYADIADGVVLAVEEPVNA